MTTRSPFQRKRRKEGDSSLPSSETRASTAAASKSTGAPFCDLLFSSSDEENRNNGRSIKKKTETPQKSSGASWLTSINSRRTDGYSSSSDDDREENDTSVTNSHRKHDSISMERSAWTTSSTAEVKFDHLFKIESPADKALQMLLWEIGFDYNVLAHQFEAVRFVAGVAKTFPLAVVTHNENDSGSDSASGDFDSSNNGNEHTEILALDLTGEMIRYNRLKQPQLLVKTRGCLLADEMGLGKTIEALGGAALRNHLISGNGVKRKSKTMKKPTLIVTPQDGIQQQWYDALLRSGVDPARICVIGERKRDTNARGGSVYKKSSVQDNGMYILLTRYKIQSELKQLFEQTTTANLKSALLNSILFHHIPPLLIGKLRNQYLAEKGKERNKYIHSHQREKRQDCITRLIRESFNDDKFSFKIAFNTVIIDECHFLKNVLAYWGIGAALLGGQSKRTVLLSGTPYNNGPSDMSALMTFIDPSNEAARLIWWEKAVGKGKKKAVADAVSHWRSRYMLRRQKGVLLELPARERRCLSIPPFASELFIYENYEFSFLSALNKLQEAMDDANPDSIRRQKELCDIMMACMACMRMALIHPIIPGGREITIRFSPSRRHLLKRQENKDQCVLCSGKGYPTQRAEEFAARRACEESGDEFIENEDYFNLLGLDAHVRAEMDLDDDELDDEDVVLTHNNTRVIKDKCPLVELDLDVCQAAGSECLHFAHKKCLAVFLENGGHKCPRCYDLSSRIHISNKDGNSNVTHRVYCTKTQTTASGRNGFTASTKIVKVIDWFQTSVPEDEKAIILSFFKGSLDLMEGILSDELGIECARYDGDVSKEQRAEDLKRFQTNKSCRVLLASVQSGGTGLNITQANHVCFLDRWFNPQVHDQAESRVHRIGQSRDVKISYLDTALTVDCVMKIVNEYKLDNASVLLADGTSLGDVRGGVTYKDLSGVIGDSIKAIRIMRRNVIELNEQTGNTNLPIAMPFNDDQLFDKVQEVINSRSMNQKKEDDDKSSSSNVEEDWKPSMSMWPASQESSSSNDSILDYEIWSVTPKRGEDDSSKVHSKVEEARKPSMWPASQESSSSSDSILDYDMRSNNASKLNYLDDFATDKSGPRSEMVDEDDDINNDDGDDVDSQTNAPSILKLIDQAGDDVSKLSPFEKEILTMKVADEPTTGTIARVQTRMPNGKRIVRKFDGNSPVKLIYAYAAQSDEEARSGKPFELKAKFPPVGLRPSAEKSILSCGLSGETIFFFWK